MMSLLYKYQSLWFQILPSGRTTLIFSTDIRLFMSLWILSATPGYWEEYESNKRSYLCRQKKTGETGTGCVCLFMSSILLPGSSWLFLCRLLTRRDAPDRWRRRRTVCLQRTTVCLSSRAPAPRLKLSTHTHAHRVWKSHLVIIYF